MDSFTVFQVCAKTTARHQNEQRFIFLAAIISPVHNGGQKPQATSCAKMHLNLT